MRRLRVGVVGGGIIGVAVARRVCQVVDRAEVTLMEKEDHLAAHQSGHNSGVVHSGVYYLPGTLKARLTRRGVGQLEQFAHTHGVPLEERGKLVIAADREELPRLDDLVRQAQANQVPGVRRIDADEIGHIEPHARGVAALYSPHTAVVDFAALTNALADDMRDRGGRVLLEHEVRSIRTERREVLLEVGPRRGHFDLVITCAGLQADRVAHQAGDPRSPRIIPFYGDYFALKPARSALVKGLIYPLPDPKLPFLGIHLTRQIDDTVLIGPNAYLAAGREDYERRRPRLSDLRGVVGSVGFWRFSLRYLSAAVRENRTALSARTFIGEASRYIPELKVADVRPAFRGIRAQALRGDGRLTPDFLITGTDRVLHVRNAPSPGATAALAIAELVVDQALERVGIRPSRPEAIAAHPSQFVATR